MSVCTKFGSGAWHVEGNLYVLKYHLLQQKGKGHGQFYLHRLLDAIEKEMAFSKGLCKPASEESEQKNYSGFPKKL